MLGTGVKDVVGLLFNSVMSLVSCVMPLMSRLPTMMACQTARVGRLATVQQSARCQLQGAGYLKSAVLRAIVPDVLQLHGHGKLKGDGVPYTAIPTTAV